MQLSQPLAVVTPTLDGPVLTALALADRAFTTGQLGRVLGRGSAEGIRKVLHRLTEQGVVAAERVGPAVSYRLNHHHLAAQHIIGLANLRSTFLSRIEQKLAGWEQRPVYAAVFGSAGRGEMRPDSDIDLLLVRANDTDETIWEQQVGDLVESVVGWTGNDVRPLEYTVAELGPSRGEPVLREVLRTGLTIAGDRSWLGRRLRPGTV
ncbi:nucleotidyltransferase domain-containing protein [Jiangella muralis]|uniref:nucleotidyltransferase domain-containing protein n=1 Tax=Jiangella muralis TaxID=702383 RepID=UPI00069FF670|nr:nucleotidyltransferase domain-containing protein [Jiangella muralis]